MMKSILSRLFPADMWRGRLSVLVIAAFLKLILFDVVWCTGTTFRAMSDIGLYLNALLGRHMGGRGRQISVSSRPVWSTE